VFANLYLVTDKLQTISPHEIDALERTLGLSLPEGYYEYMTTLGVGTYCDLLRVYEPRRVLEESEKMRNLWRDYCFWEAGREILSKEQILEAIIFADTEVGDNVVLSTDMPDRLFVLPRDDDTVYWVPENFRNPLLWRSQDGIVHRPPEFQYFESWRDRACVELFTALKSFELAELAERFIDQWSNSEIHTIDLRHRAEEEDADQLMFLFIKDIGGRVQLDKGVGDGRVGIRIDYDLDSANQVGLFLQTLVELGFYETSRY